MLALCLCLGSDPQLSAQEVAPTLDVSSSIAQKSSDSASVESLLKKLDSPSFKDREAATDELIELGPAMFKPLITYFFESSSSEAGWRIHRILEGIGKNGQEESFLKSIAIIQVLYGAQDRRSQDNLANLQYQWKQTRRTEAAQALKKQGFQFFAQNDGRLAREVAIDRARMDLIVRAADARAFGGGGIEIAIGPEIMEPGKKTKTELPSNYQWQDPRKDQDASIQKIEKIIDADAENNRKIVESLLPESVNVSLPAGILEFPENWKPDEKSLKLINSLSTLSQLSFRKQTIDANLREFISKQPALKGLHFINCEFAAEDDAKSSQLALPKTISNLVFEGSLPAAESLRSLGQIGSLSLTKVELDDDFAAALSRCKIQSMALEEVKFDRKSIRRLVSMRGLYRVTMSLCQFKLEWFEDARKRNPSLISASPKSFLGVQGPIDISDQELSGCQISRVVPNTAASKGGMQPLDVVTAMDGNKIVRFEDLRLLISQKRPGETMKLEVRRGSKTVNLEVKLGENDQSIR